MNRASLLVSYWRKLLEPVKIKFIKAHKITSKVSGTVEYTVRQCLTVHPCIAKALIDGGVAVVYDN